MIKENGILWNKGETFHLKNFEKGIDFLTTVCYNKDGGGGAAADAAPTYLVAGGTFYKLDASNCAAGKVVRYI